MKSGILLSLVALASAAVISQTSSPQDDAVTKRVKYGPYKLQKAVGTAADPKGVKTTILRPNVEKPCVDCTLKAMKGGIVYKDGSEATGPIYLHHAALINTGPNAKDGTCARPAYDLFFSTGNERSPIIYNDPESKLQAGYYISNSDVFTLQSEVVNSELAEKEVWVYFDYNYVKGKPQGHQQTKVVWLSAGGTPCAAAPDLGALTGKTPAAEPKLGAGELYPPNDKKFTLKSKSWTSPWTGNFVALGGHVHDGGINVEIYQNDKLICNSQANYAVGNSTGMAPGHPGASAPARHISSMTGCRSSDSVKAGDRFNLVVNYDFEKNPGMKDKDDKLLPIMAAATLFIGAKN